MTDFWMKNDWKLDLVFICIFIMHKKRNTLKRLWLPTWILNIYLYKFLHTFVECAKKDRIRMSVNITGINEHGQVARAWHIYRFNFHQMYPRLNTVDSFFSSIFQNIMSHTSNVTSELTDSANADANGMKK